jgi:choice-of-anchor A domain-containing protein
MNNKSLQSKTHSVRIRRRNRGFALPITMCAVMILFVMGVGVLAVGMQSRRFAVNTSSGIAARCAADAGVTQALYEMNKKVKVLPWNNGSLPKVIRETLPNNDAVYGYTVTGDLTKGHNLKSTGAYGLRQRTIRCSLPLQGLFEYALFGDNYVHLKSGGNLTCYNCDSDDRNLQIGTNSTLADTLDLKNASIVNGDAVIGVGGDPGVVISDTSGGIKGNTYIMPKEHELPEITVPESLASLPSGGTIHSNKTIISSSAKYDKIDLGNSKILTIKGQVSLYIVGDMILDNSAQLRIIDSNDASLTLFVGGNIEIKNGGVINNLSKDATKLKIFGLNSCQNLTLKNGGDFYGAIYAPNADVVMMNSGDMYGSVIAKSVEQKNSSTFHYDVSLREVSIEDIGVRFVIRQWQEE